MQCKACRFWRQSGQRIISQLRTLNCKETSFSLPLYLFASQTGISRWTDWSLELPITSFIYWPRLWALQFRVECLKIIFYFGAGRWPWITREMPRLLYSRLERTGNFCDGFFIAASPVTAGNAQRCQSWWCGVISSSSWKRKTSIHEEWADERCARARNSPSIFSSDNNSSLSLTKKLAGRWRFSLGRLVWERSNQFRIMEPDETSFKNILP